MDRSGAHSQNGPPSLGGNLLQLIRDRMSGDPSWNHVTRNGSWLCPFCLSSVKGADATRAALQRAIDNHLGRRCTAWHGGRGHPQPEHALITRHTYEDIAHCAGNEPAWQVFDHEGFWYSPSSLQRVATVRLNNGRFDSFTVQAMVNHLANCPQYCAGTVYDATTTQRARDASVRTQQLTPNIQQLLQYPLWRYTNTHGYWVCPFCLGHIGSVPLHAAQDWDQAPARMAAHVAVECAAYVADRPEPRPEELVRQAAGAAPGTIPPPPAATTSGAVPLRRTTTTTALPTTPSRVAMPVTPQHGARVATPVPRQPSPTVTPAIKPASARYPGPIGRLVRGSDQGAPATPKKCLLDQLEEEASRPNLVVPEIAPEMIAEEELPEIDPDSAMTVPASSPGIEASDPSPHFNWMDDAEEAAPATKQHSGRMDTDRIKARDVQKNLLGKVPSVPGYRFAVRFEACTDVSGDFYDFVTLSDGRICFAQGDVSGHGMHAGLIMSMAKKTLSIYAASGGSPRDTLAVVNDNLVDDLAGKIFISIAYGIIDPGVGTLNWVRAGHSPTLRYNIHTDECEELRPKGMVVGMKKGAVFRDSLEEQAIQTRSGDIFLIYTDGITETMNRQRVEYGTELLIEVVRKHASAGVDALLDRILESISQFRGGTVIDDDVTLMAISVD